MQPKTLAEWKELYIKKTGDTVLEGDISRHLFYLPDRGFCVLSIDTVKSRLNIWEVCGDGKFWRDFALMEADGQGLSSMCTTTTRNIKAFLKCLWGKEFQYGLMNMIVCVNEYGHMATCTPRNNGEWFIEAYLQDNNYN